MPWIEFNGQEIADSNFCIRFLEKEFQVAFERHRKSHLSRYPNHVGGNYVLVGEIDFSLYMQYCILLLSFLL